MKERISKALAPVFEKLLQPENFDRQGMRLYVSKSGRSARREIDPLKPRERLARRLALLVALKETELALMKEIMTDTEALEDAKAAKEEK